MTDLIRAICEAENTGEIDLNTRDFMIDIISEAKKSGNVGEMRNQLKDLIKKQKEIEKKLDDACSYNIPISSADGKDISVDGDKKTSPGLGKHRVPNNSEVGFIRTSKRDKSKMSPSEFKKLKKEYDSLEKQIKRLAKNISDEIANESAIDDIYEAELAGDITAEEREVLVDCMLEMDEDDDALCESTAQARRAKELEKEVTRIIFKINDLEELQDKFKAEGNDKMVKAIDSKIKKLEDDARQAREKRLSIDDDDNARGALTMGKRAARFYNKSNNENNDQSREDFADFARNASRDGKRCAKENPWRGNSKRTEREPGRYKTCKGLKESANIVIDDIYEAELAGDITADERRFLIGYLESKI